MLLNDSLFAVQTDTFTVSGEIMINYIFVNILPSGGFLSKIVNMPQTLYYKRMLSMIESPMQYHYLRPYIPGSLNRNILISCDQLEQVMARSYSWDNYTYYRQTYNYVNRVMDSTPLNTPCADAYNTCRSISSTKILCTNGFPYSTSCFKPGNVSTELFAADIGDPHPHATASALGAIYLDTVHRQNQLQNIILDTIKKRVYLIFTNTMSILSYQNVTVGAVSRVEKLFSSQSLTILPNSFSSGITIVIPNHSASMVADFSFYDLSGRLVDKIKGIASNAVIWKPQIKSPKSYIVMAKIDGRTFIQKFIMR
jgi:hypothetical protein